MNAGDRELLELAAKAAGIELDWDVPPSASPWRITGDGDDKGPASPWNPFHDSGDAMDLAVSLRAVIDVSDDGNEVCVGMPSGHHWTEICGPNPYAATRRAIVRAAAEIGKAMP